MPNYIKLKEIFPSVAKSAGAFIVATGRSDFKNQVNNLLAFPGLFRGIIDVKSSKITMEMKLKSAHVIADLVSNKEISPDYIVPGSLDFRIPIAVSREISQTAILQRFSRKKVSSRLVEDNMKNYLIDGALRNLIEDENYFTKETKRSSIFIEQLKKKN